VAREKAIDVLEEKYCNMQLTNFGAKKFKVTFLLHARRVARLGEFSPNG
jgi:hypothetical protein